MSGSASATFPQPVTLSTFPKEGSRAVNLALNWLDYQNEQPDAYTVPVNLLAQFQSGNFTTCQAVMVDNSLCCSPVRITSVETGLSITVPGFAQGCYPLLCGPAPAFIIRLIEMFAFTLFDVAGRSTRFAFLNTPQREWQTVMPAQGWGGTVIKTGRTDPMVAGVPFPALPSPVGPGVPARVNAISLFSWRYFSFAVPVSVNVIVSLVEVDANNNVLQPLWHTEFVSSTTANTMQHAETISFPTLALQVFPNAALAWLVNQVASTGDIIDFDIQHTTVAIDL